MAGATTTTLTAAIKTLYQPGMPKTFYEGTPLLNLLGFPGKPHLAGDSIDWQVNYAGNAGAILNEGDALPAAGNQSFVNLTVAHVTFANVVQITAQAKAAMKNGYFDGVKAELDGGLSGLKHKVEEKFVSLLEGAINNDTNYGGQTRATYHLDSDVTAGGSAANTLANMSEMYETLQLDPRAVVYNPADHIITSAPEQLTAYTEIGGALVYSEGGDPGATLRARIGGEAARSARRGGERTRFRASGQRSSPGRGDGARRPRPGLPALCRAGGQCGQQVTR